MCFQGEDLSLMILRGAHEQRNTYQLRRPNRTLASFGTAAGLPTIRSSPPLRATRRCASYALRYSDEHADFYLCVQVKIWTLPSASASAAEWSCSATLKFEEAATAVAATTLPSQRCACFSSERTMNLTHPWRILHSLHILAVGLENGQIRLLSAPFSDSSAWTPYLTLGAEYVISCNRRSVSWTDPPLCPRSIAHVLTVTTLSFSPKVLPDGRLRLASGSDDRSVRIIDIEP